MQFRHVNGAAGQKLLPETMGGGVVVFDYDADGRPDLFFVNSRPWASTGTPPARSAIYRNTGNGKYDDVTAVVGLTVTHANTCTVSMAIHPGIAHRDQAREQAMEAAGCTPEQVLDVIAQVGYTSLANWLAKLCERPLDEAFTPQRWSPAV